ncbi:MAG TPA: hypothetical protein VH054_27315 [Polyangiaceae bacterium]|nr:hypothetical protein [Polyangiaceae bacterium]
MKRPRTIIVFLVALAGCSSSSAPNVGAACGFSGDNACVGGTQCIVRPDVVSHALDGGAGSACLGGETLACSTTCASDDDCKPLGAGVFCQLGCSPSFSACQRATP